MKPRESARARSLFLIFFCSFGGRHLKSLTQKIGVRRKEVIGEQEEEEEDGDDGEKEEEEQIRRGRKERFEEEAFEVGGNTLLSRGTCFDFFIEPTTRYIRCVGRGK